jgi:hypothetical protein
VSPFRFTGGIKKIIQDFIAAIRAAMLRLGVPLKHLTPVDLHALARYGAKVGKSTLYNMQGTGLNGLGTLNNGALALASRKGYKGNDPSEAAEWLRAKAKGLGMSDKARMDRARQMGYITDLQQLIKGEQNGNVRTEMGGGIGKSENKQGLSTLGHADTATPQIFYH